LADEDGATVVLIGAPSERSYVAAVRALIGEVRHGFVLDWSGALPFDEFLALLAQADAVVSNDSGPMHLAAGMGTPTIGLFGPETPVLYGPLGPRAHALWKPVVCSPCINVHNNKQVTCWRGTPECLTGISSDEVLAETRVLLAGERAEPRTPGAAVEGSGLGLSIVRTLVTTELGGTIVMRAGMHGDFEAVGIEGVRDGTGTVVQLTVPIG
jgi:hypothetical protein